jgi:ClpP class serine protease
MTDQPEKFSRIRQLVFNRPWAVTQDYLDIIAEVVVQASTDFASGNRQSPIGNRQSQSLRLQDGVPIIEVDGVISKKMNLFSDVSGGTSIEQLSAQFDEAMATDANAIIFNVHSPGGSVDGVDELAQKIFDARSSNKTIIGLADNMAASAAYWIVSQADEFYVTSGGSAGSIGVIARILDDTRMLKNAGIDPVIIRSGDLKAAGLGPMTPEQENSVRKQIDTFANMFNVAVARARPQVNLPDVTRGQMFVGRDAVDVGLADGITTLNALVKRYAK